ncbi:MAG: cell division FtsZ family protein, partial [Paramuribaculum sp.]|nr:cell division FtsZ family protein [Paramuribaculum sp.]
MDENNLNIDEFADKFKNNTEPQSPTDIMVIGVGGGGGNAVNHMYRQGAKEVTFVVCNTDKKAVDESVVPNKVVIGNGRGAGNDPKKAEKFAEEDIEKIRAIFNDETRMVFITAGMGGGTGTGAGPVVAREARERGLLTIGIVTIPFLFEGKRKILKALEGADEMAKYVDALLIINNERLTEIYPDLDFFNAFGKADDTLSTAARSISEIITTTGYINVDFEDVDRTLRGGGTAIISTGYGEGEHRVTKAIEDALNSPLLRNRDIFGSRSLLLNLYMSRDGDNSMAMTEVQELRNFVADINPEVDIIWGVTVDNTLGEKVRSGCSPRDASLRSATRRR